MGKYMLAHITAWSSMSHTVHSGRNTHQGNFTRPHYGKVYVGTHHSLVQYVSYCTLRLKYTPRELYKATLWESICWHTLQPGPVCLILYTQAEIHTKGTLQGHTMGKYMLAHITAWSSMSHTLHSGKNPRQTNELRKYHRSMTPKP